MSDLTITQIPALQDNYVYLLHTDETTVVVDPSESAPVIKELETRGWSLNAIWNTHHHPDHVGGNEGLVARYGADVFAFHGDFERIPMISHEIAGGDTLQLGDYRFEVIEIPGHTRGHIAFYNETSKSVFCGDTLFAMGCGRLFEGTPAQMWSSLEKLKALPEDTWVYCAHEYTLQNGRFALTIEPHNKALRERVNGVMQLREDNQPTVPSLLREELQTNPFLRCDLPLLQQKVGASTAQEAFRMIRELKDSF